MPNINTSITIQYLAWDFENKIEKTGDDSNHTLYIVNDGVASVATNSPVEVNSSHTPGIYAITLTAAENNGELVTVRGVSSTQDVELIPPHWSNNVDINQIEGKILSEKTGSNLNIFFQNLASATTKIVDNVGTTTGGGNLKTGGNLNQTSDMVILSGRGHNYCKVQKATTSESSKCRIIIEKIEKSDTSSKYTRLSPYIYKISVFDISSSEAWDSTANPKSSNIDIDIEIGLDATIDPTVSDDDSYNHDSYDPIFQVYTASSLSNLESGTSITKKDFEESAGGEASYIININHYDGVVACRSPSHTNQEFFIGVGDALADDINTPNVSEGETNPGSVDVVIEFNSTLASKIHGMDIVYNYNKGSNPTDPTLASHNGILSGSNTDTTVHVTGDDETVYFKTRCVGDENEAWYIDGSVDSSSFSIPSTGEGEGEGG